MLLLQAWREALDATSLEHHESWVDFHARLYMTFLDVCARHGHVTGRNATSVQQKKGRFKRFHKFVTELHDAQKKIRNPKARLNWFAMSVDEQKEISKISPHCDMDEEMYDQVGEILRKAQEIKATLATVATSGKNWTHEETWYLLNAWREVLEDPEKVSARGFQYYTSIYERYVAACGGNTPRSESSVAYRRKSLMKQYMVIVDYNNTIQKQAGGGPGTVLPCDWYSLNRDEREKIFRQSRHTTHHFTNIDPDVFETMDIIEKMEAKVRTKNVKMRGHYRRKLRIAKALRLGVPVQPYRRRSANHMSSDEEEEDDSGDSEVDTESSDSSATSSNRSRRREKSKRASGRSDGSSSDEYTYRISRTGEVTKVKVPRKRRRVGRTIPRSSVNASKPTSATAPASMARSHEAIIIDTSNAVDSDRDSDSSRTETDSDDYAGKIDPLRDLRSASPTSTSSAVEEHSLADNERDTDSDTDGGRIVRTRRSKRVISANADAGGSDSNNEGETKRPRRNPWRVLSVNKTNHLGDDSAVDNQRDSKIGSRHPGESAPAGRSSRRIIPTRNAEDRDTTNNDLGSDSNEDTHEVTPPRRSKRATHARTDNIVKDSSTMDTESDDDDRPDARSPTNGQTGRGIDPEITAIVNIFGKQAQHLGAMLRQAREERKREHEERQEILKQLQRDREERELVMEKLQRDHDNRLMVLGQILLDREERKKDREERRLEREDMVRELETLRKEKLAGRVTRTR